MINAQSSMVDRPWSREEEPWRFRPALRRGRGALVLRYILALVPDIDVRNEILQDTAVDLGGSSDPDMIRRIHSPPGPAGSRSAAC